MAKTEGVLDIPSDLFRLYKASFALKKQTNIVKRRLPFKRTGFEAGGKKVTAIQLKQRERFLAAKKLFAGLDAPERGRWFDARPEWNSLLWYYNYFMMSALSGNANQTQGGCGVIKLIQVVDKVLNVDSDTVIDLTTVVDPAKSVVFLFGNSSILDRIRSFSGSGPDNSSISLTLDPEVDLDRTSVIVSGGGGFQDLSEGSGSGKWADWTLESLDTDKVKIRMDNIDSPGSFSYSVTVTEHLNQTVYPIIRLIESDKITVGWPVPVDVAARISALVIEYI